MLLISSIVMLFVADTAYAFQVASDTYVDGGLLDTLWLASYVAISAGALHGSMRDVAAPHPVSVAWLSRLRLSLLAIAMLTGPLLIMVVNVQWESDVAILAMGSAFLSVLVLVRLATVVRALARDNAARMTLEGELSYRASHDPLTGLPNRRRFIERLESVLAVPDRRPLSVLFLDLDDFKTVNDSLGTPPGTSCSSSVATRLQRHLRAEDRPPASAATSSRIILDGKEASRRDDGRGAAPRRARRARGGRRPAGRRVAPASGSSTRARPASRRRELLAQRRHRDVRGQGRRQGPRSHVRSRASGPRCRTAMALEADLRGVVDRGELRIEYQPIIELATGSVVGVEALVRWQHPTPRPAGSRTPSSRSRRRPG